MLIDTLKRHLRQAPLGYSQDRLDLLSRLLPALLTSRTVNLKEVATALSSPALPDSRYRRRQRFFASGLSTQPLSAWIVERLLSRGQPAYVRLSMDRTHWMFGQTPHNPLCLGLDYQGVAIPLEVMALDKVGNSNTEERMCLFERAWTYLKNYRCCLLADREFIGAEWFDFLLGHEGLDFIIRLRTDCWITPAGQARVYLQQVVEALKPGQSKGFHRVRLYDGSIEVVLNLIAYRTPADQVIVLATNRSNLKKALRTYQKRWAIESAFAALKSRGFNLEATHMIHPERLALLMMVLAVALMWGLLIGYQHHQHTPIRNKKHGRRTLSLFRLGLDRLRDAIYNREQRPLDFPQFCQFLVSCT